MSKRRPFDPGDEGYFSVDDATGQLFWNDELVQTESRVVLSGKQSAWAVVVAISTAIGAIAASFSACAAMTAQPNVPVEKAESASRAVPLPSLRIATFSVHFDSGVSRSKAESGSSLTNAFRVLVDNPQATAVIRAYTDGIGSAALNQRLAEERAANVRQFLTSRSISPGRITVAPPVAADNPYADNATLEGRAQNRRVEVEIVTVPQPAPVPTS